MKRPWMPLYIADYRADTAHLSAAQHGAYLLLIMHYWQTGGLPNDDEQLARIACMWPEEWHGARPTIEALFDGCNWRHKRIDAELKKAREISRKRSESAKVRYSKTAQDSENPKQFSKASAHANAHANAEQLHTQPLSQSQKNSGGGSNASARDPALISEEAHVFAGELAAIAGHDPEFLPPQWVSKGPAHRVQMMLDAGWQIDVMREAAKAAMRNKHDGPPDSIRYFEKIFARAHAPQAPLATAQIHSRADPPTELDSREINRKRWRDALDELGQYPDDAPTGSDVRPPTLRVLSGSRSG